MSFNHLLDYRSRDRLERLTEEDRIDLLSDVLARGPAESAWQALFELFALWPEGPARAGALDRTEQALASWDDRLRRADSSKAALYAGHRLAPLARLVRTVDIYRREQRGSAELDALATSEWASNLSRLSILDSEISGRAWEAALKSRHLMHLRHLHVISTTLVEADVRRVWTSPALQSLRCLKLIDVGATAPALEPDEASRPFPDLRRLDLSRNLLGDDGVARLAEAAWLDAVERLSLRHNFIRDPASVGALLASSHAARLREIDLLDNQVAAAPGGALVRLAATHGVTLVI